MSRDLMYFGVALGVVVVALSIADAIQRAKSIEIVTPKMALRASDLSPRGNQNLW